MSRAVFAAQPQDHRAGANGPRRTEMTTVAGSGASRCWADLERIASMIEQDAAAKGHQFSDCADVFMRLKIQRTKERDELQYKLCSSEQVVREACELLRECLHYVTGGPGSNYLNNRISVWLETVEPNPKADPAAVVGGSASSELLDSESSTGANP